MLVLFPDGNLITFENIGQLIPNPAGPTLKVLLNAYFGVYTYTSYDVPELENFMSLLTQPQAASDTIYLPSHAPAPAGGGASITLNPVTGPAAGGTVVVLYLANTSPINEAFQMGAKVVFDATICPSTTWISHCALMCVTPAHAAGAVAISYVDAAGTVTKAGAYTYT